MLEDDLDVWGVGLLGVGEEVDHLDQDGVDQLLGGVGGVAGDGKDHRHYFVQEDRKVVFLHPSFENLFYHICYDSVDELACDYFDLVSSIGS